MGLHAPNHPMTAMRTSLSHARRIGRKLTFPTLGRPTIPACKLFTIVDLYVWAGEQSIWRPIRHQAARSSSDRGAEGNACHVCPNLRPRLNCPGAIGRLPNAAPTARFSDGIARHPLEMARQTEPVASMMD